MDIVADSIHGGDVRATQCNIRDDVPGVLF